MNMEETQIKEQTIRPLPEIIKEVVTAVEAARASGLPASQKIKDYRWQFDQVSAKMNQAIYNNQVDQIHASCLATIAILIEILSRQP